MFKEDDHLQYYEVGYPVYIPPATYGEHRLGTEEEAKFQREWRCWWSSDLERWRRRNSTQQAKVDTE